MSYDKIKKQKDKTKIALLIFYLQNEFAKIKLAKNKKQKTNIALLIFMCKINQQKQNIKMI